MGKACLHSLLCPCHAVQCMQASIPKGHTILLKPLAHQQLWKCTYLRLMYSRRCACGMRHCPSALSALIARLAWMFTLATAPGKCGGKYDNAYLNLQTTACQLSECRHHRPSAPGFKIASSSCREYMHGWKRPPAQSQLRYLHEYYRSRMRN